MRDAFIRVSGGIRSRELLEILCDILGRPLQVLAEREVSALGAAQRIGALLEKGPPSTETIRPGILHVEPRKHFVEHYKKEAAKQKALFLLYRKGGYFS